MFIKHLALLNPLIFLILILFITGSFQARGQASSVEKLSAAVQLPRFQNCNSRYIDTAPNDIRITATGDLVFSEFENINRSAFTDFMPFLKQADLVLGNLEGAITEYNQPRKPYVPGKSYSFRFPPSTANLLKQANFHVISIANNHVHDFGPIGFSDTQRYLSQVGIETTGLKSSYIIRTVKGKRIAVISLAYYPVFNNVLEIDEAANLVKEVRAKSDIVVLYYQMGAEGDSAIKISADNEIFLGENRGNPRQFAKAMVNAGAHALIGHGPHVLRAAECIDGTPILHSIGNFIGAGGLNARQFASVSVLPEILFDSNAKFKALRLIPATFTLNKFPIHDPSDKAIHLINFLNQHAQKTFSDIQPIYFQGDQTKIESFEHWLNQNLTNQIKSK